MDKIKIITDSTCDLSKEIIEKYDIDVMPMLINFGEEIELRTMDGKAHSEIFNTVITLKGLEFLKPDRTKTKANLAIIISAIAGAVSLGSLLVSVLANLDKIIRNLEILNDLLI